MPSRSASIQAFILKKNNGGMQIVDDVHIRIHSPYENKPLSLSPTEKQKKMIGDIQNSHHAHSPWSAMNPPDHFAGGNGTTVSSLPSPRRVELQGPRPTALKVNKDSHKIRKPPTHQPQLEKLLEKNQENRGEQAGLLLNQQQQQQHKPVIIYAVSPKVIHTTVSDFMSVVQRLTGPDVAATSSSSAGGGGGDVSPAARLASIERTVNSPSGNINKHKDQFVTMMMNSTSGFGLGDVDGIINNSSCNDDVGLLDDILGDYCMNNAAAADVDGAGFGTRGVLSPAPGNMPPPISPGFFSSAAVDPWVVGGVSNPYVMSPSAAALCWSPAVVSQSPTSAAAFDIFNPFFDF